MMNHFCHSLVRMLVMAFMLVVVGASVMAQNIAVVQQGKVTDRDGNPLSMASVTVKGTVTGTYTNDDGRFSLKVKPGNLVLVVQFMGYESQEVQIDARTGHDLHIQLVESGYTLHGVTVTAKSKEQQLREGAFTVSALDIKSIASSVTNLNDLVSRSSGVNIRTDGGLGSNFDLSLNGMSGNSIRYFVDGVPLSTRGSGVTMANFPINSIDHIEVYKGVVPSKLGGDALGGAINIITKQERKNFVDASVSVGSFGTYMADLNAQVVLPKCGILVRPQFSVNRSKNNYKVHNVEVWNADEARYDTVTRRRFHDAYENYNAQLEVGVEKKSWADVFMLGATFNQTDKEIQTGTIQSIVFGKAERKEKALGLQAKYRKDQFLLDALSLNLHASYTWDHSITVDTAFQRYNWNGTYKEQSRNELIGRERMYRHYKRPMATVRGNLNYVVNAQHALNLNYLLTRTGNRRYDTVEDYYPYLKDTFEPTNDVILRHVLGLGYEQNLLEGRWVNSFFLKDYVNKVTIEQNDTPLITGANDVAKKTTKNTLGGGFGSRFTIWEPLSVKLSYERAQRLPQARELLGNGSTTYPNLKLKPEQSHNINLGVYGNWQMDQKNLLYYELTGFWRKVEDYIHLRVNDNDGTAQYENVNDVTTKGLEGEVRYQHGRWLQAVANVSYQQSLDMNKYLENGGVSATYKNRVPNKPWLYSNLDLTLTGFDFLKQGDRLRFNALYQYVHWFYLSWEGYGYLPSKARIPSQHMVNAQLTYSWNQDRYSVTLECDNVLDKLAFDNYKLQKPGRSFMTKFRVYLR